MNIPDDKEFDLAVEKAIDEIFGASKPEEITVVEDDSLKTPLELEPIEKEESKVIEFPNLDELLEPEVSEPEIERKGLSQKDLEKLAAVLLSLEWELSLENCLDFLTALEEAKQKSNPEIHEIFDLMYEVGTWLRDRSHEARPEWLHFLHQGIVALNLITIHGKDPGPYLDHLRKGLAKLSSHPNAAATEEGKLLRKFAKQLTLDYQRFVLFDWLFAKSPRLRGWQKISQKALREIEDLLKELPSEWQPDLKALAEAALKKICGKRPVFCANKGATPPFREGYICEQSLKKYVVPADEVCFIGSLRDNWQEALASGYFPLKMLLGPWGFLPFVKLKNRLSGELAEKEEDELRRLKLPVPQSFRQGESLLILWKGDQGVALGVDEAEPISIPEEARLVKDKEHPGGLLVLGQHRYPVITAQKATER